jgi:hypothetical protein
LAGLEVAAGPAIHPARLQQAGTSTAFPAIHPARLQLDSDDDAIITE